MGQLKVYLKGNLIDFIISNFSNKYLQHWVKELELHERLVTKGKQSWIRAHRHIDKQVKDNIPSMSLSSQLCLKILMFKMRATSSLIASNNLNLSKKHTDKYRKKNHPEPTPIAYESIYCTF